MLLLLLPISPSFASHAEGKSTGAALEQSCSCNAPPPAPAAAGTEAASSTHESLDGEGYQSRSCSRRDVQKMFLSAIAGAFFAIAISGRRTRLDAQTWTKRKESSAQTYEEPNAPDLPLPPIIQYLPPPPPRPAKMPLPELVYESVPPPPRRAASSQTRAMAVESNCQTEWMGAPAKVQREAQTMRPADSFAMGTQCVGIPHTDSFAQAVVRTREAATQWELPSAVESRAGAAGPGNDYHLLLSDEHVPVGTRQAANASGSGGAAAPDEAADSGSGRSNVFRLDKMLQTEPHGVSAIGVQTNSLYSRAAGAQTSPLHPPINEGTQTGQ